MDAYSPLQHVLQQVWALWEVLVLGEPLMVAAPTPGELRFALMACLVLLGYWGCWVFQAALAARACLAASSLTTDDAASSCLLGLTEASSFLTTPVSLAGLLMLLPPRPQPPAPVR